MKTGPADHRRKLAAPAWQAVGTFDITDEAHLHRALDSIGDIAQDVGEQLASPVAGAVG